MFRYFTHLTKYRAKFIRSHKIHTLCNAKNLSNYRFMCETVEPKKSRKIANYAFENSPKRSVKNTVRVDVKMSESKVKDRCRLACAGLCNWLNTVRLTLQWTEHCAASAGLCNGLNTVQLLQDFAMNWTLCSFCRTLQLTENFAASVGLYNGLNTVQLLQDFAMDWTLCGSHSCLQLIGLCYLPAWGRAFRQIVKNCSGER